MVKKIVDKTQVTTTEYTLRLTEQQASFLLGLLNHIHNDDIDRVGLGPLYDDLGAAMGDQPETEWTVTTEESAWCAAYSIIRVLPKA